MARDYRASAIWRSTLKPFGVGCSEWLSANGSEESTSMSWMTKGGLSSASGQSPLRFPLNGFARRGIAPTEHESATV
jgi:hypothetical protein